MLNLSAKNIRLNGSAANKEEAIKLVAAGLVANGNVENGYEAGMLAREQQTSTFLGNGIAIPHGTLDTRGLVKETGVQIIQFPQGIEWSEGNTAYVAIGIAAKSDEHLTLLRQLTTVLSDEEAAEKLAKTQDVQEFADILSGKKNLPAIAEENLSLNIDTSNLITLSAVNAGKLQEKGYVNQQFISDVVAQSPLALGNNVFIVDSAKGNLANGIAVARSTQGQTLVSVAAVDSGLETQLARLLNTETRTQLAAATAVQIVALFNGEAVSVSANPAVNSTASSAGQVIGTFTVRNENGIHARPSAVLVQTLGASKGARLRFVAEGEDAQQAMETLAKAFETGLGESVSFVPEVADTIEGNVAQTVPTTTQPVAKQTPVLAEGALEASFVIQNEHGLHARPSAVLVNEVKKYASKIEVQNVDKNSPLVSAKSLMKIVALGVTKGTTLRFVATGEDAQVALDGIGAAIAAGLGEK